MSDWLTLAEFGSPLVVSLVAVWLGFRYQRLLAEAHARRDTWARMLGHLNRMMDCVETAERLTFVSYLVAALDEGGSKTKGGAGTRDPAVQATVDLCATLIPGQPWLEALLSDEDGPARFVHVYPGYLGHVNHARFEEARRALRDEGPYLLLSRPPIWRSRRGLGLFQACQVLTFHLARVFHAIDFGVPAKVDWDPINRLILGVETAAVRDIGAGTRLRVGLVQFREELPWPPGTPTLQLEASATNGRASQQSAKPHPTAS